jgi:hypothetical protein
MLVDTTLTSITGESVSVMTGLLVSHVLRPISTTTTREIVTTRVTVAVTDQTHTIATAVSITPTWTGMDTVTARTGGTETTVISQMIHSITPPSTTDQLLL